jgi:YtkA-like
VTGFARGALLFCLSILLWADGGTLVVRREAGPFTVSIFTTPEPLRVGPGDVSVLLERTSDKKPVLDAKVDVRLTHSGAEGISNIFAPATHANATNKLLYAAHVNLAADGPWKLTAAIDSRSGTAEVAAAINVLPRPSPLVSYWPYFAVIPAIVLVFSLNQWLKSKRNATRPRARA